MSIHPASLSKNVSDTNVKPRMKALHLCTLQNTF